MIDDDDSKATFLKTTFRMGAAEAAAIVLALPGDRFKEIVGYVQARPEIAHPAKYILAAAAKEAKRVKTRRPIAPDHPPQLLLTPPTQLDEKRSAATAPPLSAEQREDARAAIARAKRSAFGALV